MNIPFNKPFLTGKEIFYIEDAVNTGKISGNGKYTKLCHEYFEKVFGFKKVLMTSSCTDALEMAAILIDIKFGDEVIVPSYTFVSTANAFVLRGAKVVFADSMSENPNIDASKIENLITAKTKAIVVVHYAGISCEMTQIMEVAEKYNLFVIEDAAQAIDSFYLKNNGEKVRLGSIGHLAAFSFHETKNIISGEGGLLIINDERFFDRSEIIWEKGTNRSAFFRGSVDKYGWVDIGSSFLPSDIISAFLFAQLENISIIQSVRKSIWSKYNDELFILKREGKLRLPFVPDYATNNAHMFYIICKDLIQRTKLVEHLKKYNIQAVFHYISLHKSNYFSSVYEGKELINADFYSDSLLRLPFYQTLCEDEIIYICRKIKEYFENEV